MLLGAAMNPFGCGQLEPSPASSTRAPEPIRSIVVLRPESATPDGPDAPPRVTLAQREQDGSLSPISGRYLDALEFRDGVAAVTRERELVVVQNDGSRSVVARDLDGLPALGSDGSLVYAARFGEVVELYRLRRDGKQQRLASLRGSATRLSPRSDGTVVFIGADLGGVSGIWIADSQGLHCLTNCGLRVGRPRSASYRALPGETSTVRLVGSRIEWTTAEGRSEFAPVTQTPSLPTKVTP